MPKKELVTELSEGEFAKFIADKKAKLVVVDFFAEWCMPCMMMAPVLETVAGNLEKKGVKFGKLNVDDAKEASMKYRISNIPCIVFFKDGKEVGRSVGAMGEEQLEKKIKGFL
jgi:thioredoxin 1